MKNPTVHILFKFIDGPWGGGNQFLKALKKELCRMGVYEGEAQKADIVIFNSFPSGHERYFSYIHHLRTKYSKTVIHRVDGPIQLVRGRSPLIDTIISYFNRTFCDGTIFQSHWSKKENHRLGLKERKYESLILNAPDPDIFFPAQGSQRNVNSKIRLITTSWSANMRKGFKLYDFLDKNLDFSKYEMSFYGNSPIQFSRIRQSGPIPSDQLAEKLREGDLFITASMNDPCSNSLLEAMHCGLPAVVINSGGNMEIVGEGGVTFTGECNVLSAIDTASKEIDRLRRQINLPHLPEVAQMYYDFCKMVHDETQNRSPRTRYMPLLWIHVLIRLDQLQKRLPIGG